MKVPSDAEVIEALRFTNRQQLEERARLARENERLRAEARRMYEVAHAMLGDAKRQQWANRFAAISLELGLFPEKPLLAAGAGEREEAG